MTTEYKKTNCHFCGYACAFIATVEDGRVVDLVPDTTRFPYDEKILAGCRRWRMNLDVLDGKDRINYPLKCVGKRGSGKWERISWDTALDEISEKLRTLAEQYGAPTLASMIGGPHTSFWPLHRFMTLFGSPNNMGIGQICWNPRIWMDVITFGWTIEADIRPGITECVVIWGTNPAHSDNSLFWRTLRDIGRNPEIPLVVIDPRLTPTAKAANLWIAPRPATDGILALGLVHVIIEEELYDKDFVNEWCHGFDELCEYIKTYTPDYVADITGVPRAQIEELARMFANARASALISGRGIDQVGKNVAPTHRAICILRAITGNIDKPGSCIMTDASDFTQEIDLEMTSAMTPKMRNACLNTPYSPLQSYDGYDKINALTMKLGRRLPERYLASAHPDLVLHAMETGDPYPVRALIVEATNPVLTYADTHRIYKALMNLDLLVVIDYYFTPTSNIADYILPSAGAIERPIFQQHGGVANIVYGGPAAVEPYYERKTDYEIFRALGLRLGQKDAWPHEKFEDALAAALAPANMTWEEYCTGGLYYKEPRPYKYLEPNAQGAPQGFATTTGKIELASEVLEELGATRLPHPLPPQDMPALCSETYKKEAQSTGAKPVTLITGARKQPYNASMYMNNSSFKKLYPAPLAELSENTARYLGVEAGDTLELSTERGNAKFKVRIIDMVDGVVSADYGWWHPENIGNPQSLTSAGNNTESLGIWESNINTLTTCSIKSGEPSIGTWSYNAIDCMARKVEEKLSWDD